MMHIIVIFAMYLGKICCIVRLTNDKGGKNVSKKTIKSTRMYLEILFKKKH
jgi:hypothetical protein